MTGQLVKINKIKREKLDWLHSLKLDMKLELLKHQIELSRIMINEILETEVKEVGVCCCCGAPTGFGTKAP